MAKASGEKRESDGVVVAAYPTDAKGPDFGHADEKGTHQGMAGHPSRSNQPGGLWPAEIGP